MLCVYTINIIYYVRVQSLVLHHTVDKREWNRMAVIREYPGQCSRENNIYRGKIPRIFHSKRTKNYTS